MDCNNKYELTDETVEFNGVTLHRIRALRDIRDIKNGDIKSVKAGDLGGYIESEKNLSTTGSCWVCNNAKVYEKAVIDGRALVDREAVVRGEACISDNCLITGNAFIEGHAFLYDNATVDCNSYIRDARIYDSVTVTESAKVFGGLLRGQAIVRGGAKVYDGEIRNSACIEGNAEIHSKARIMENSLVTGSARIYGSATIRGIATVRDNALVYGQSYIAGDATIEGDAVVCEYMDITGGHCTTDLRKSVEESIRCQTGLVPFNGEVIAYKVVNSDLTSLQDKNFQYKIGEWAEVDFYDDSILSCAEGLHFSNAHYWDAYLEKGDIMLVARIELKDIVAVQGGKIRCKRAFILGSYKQPCSNEKI
jgi:carbonic anhydrase/acetyltransferase-like protein (isoleucine patch superfamily)